METTAIYFAYAGTQLGFLGLYKAIIQDDWKVWLPMVIGFHAIQLLLYLSAIYYHTWQYTYWHVATIF